MKNGGLLLLGAVITALGAVVLVFVMAQGLGPPPHIENIPQVGQPIEADRPSLAWAVMAGLSLAVGAALIMIGMNRWRQPSARI